MDRNKTRKRKVTVEEEASRRLSDGVYKDIHRVELLEEEQPSPGISIRTLHGQLEFGLYLSVPLKKGAGVITGAIVLARLLLWLADTI
jgi:hypothetical protein